MNTATESTVRLIFQTSFTLWLDYLIDRDELYYQKRKRDLSKHLIELHKYRKKHVQQV